jgi:YHS domain-containing protein
MRVAPDQHVITYQQMNYSFCSIQCRERFLANPHLYIGYPGHKAPAQEGCTILKQRQLKLDAVLSGDMALRVSARINEMMGIRHINIKGDTIKIQYDLMQVTEAQIESALVEIGATLGHGWSERLRRTFVDFFEETEISSLEVTPGSGDHNH